MKNIFLIGFMGTGKTTIGKILAGMLGYEFFDSDEEIEKRSGKSISDIFKQEGESSFRALEAEVISELAGRHDFVLATGGGAVLSHNNMEVMAASGTIICLKAQPEVIYGRVMNTSHRPLLETEDPLAAIKSIWNTRAELYKGDFSIDTSYLEPEVAVRRIIAYLHSESQKDSFNIQFESSHCTVITGSTIIEELPSQLAPFYSKGKILAVSNPNIHQLWGGKLTKALSDQYILQWCLIPDGEEYKNIDSIEQIYDKAVQMKLSRDSLIIGFGGGVVGDMAGFAASTYMRGINYIQIPTTLLAQVDSSIGGKTAINHKEVKNLIGSFYQPKMVVADTSMLLTLPTRELNAGLAEVIKYGVIGDYAFFEYLEQNLEKIQDLDHRYLAYVIGKCCKAKAALVQKDERDNSVRMLLNYGHTIGHAIEAATGYNLFRHGEAVSLGMEGAAYISVAMGFMQEEAHNRQSRLLEKAQLPIRFPEMDVEKVFQLMQSDKKVQNGKLRLVLPIKLGHAEVFEDIPSEYIRNSLEQLTKL